MAIHYVIFYYYFNGLQDEELLLGHGHNQFLVSSIDRHDSVESIIVCIACTKCLEGILDSSLMIRISQKVVDKLHLFVILNNGSHSILSNGLPR